MIPNLEERGEWEGKEGKKVRKKDKKKKKRQAMIDAALQQEQDVIQVHADTATQEGSTEFKNEDPSQGHHHDEPTEQEDALRRASIPASPNSPIPTPPIPAPSIPTSDLNSNLGTTKPDEDFGDQGEYESTLLAVIGILDTLKYESNVAGWIRAGGLWGAKALAPRAETTGMGMLTGEERAVSPADLELEKEEEGAKEEAEASAPPSSSPVSSQIKRQRSIASEGDGPGLGNEHDVKRTKFDWTAEAGVEAEEAPEADLNADLLANPIAGAEKVMGTGANKDVEAETGIEETKMWFEDEETVRYWIGRGRAALKELGIKERDGVCLD